jgi:hypothetical protein
MPRGFPAMSRTLSGLITGALILTSVTLATAPASAAPERAPDAAAMLEAARKVLPAPPAPSADAPEARPIQPMIADLPETLDSAQDETLVGPLGQAKVDTSSADTELDAEGATLRGAVTDSAGAPIEGIQVAVYGHMDDDPVTAVAFHSASTGADGTWSLSGIEAIADYWVVQFGDPQERFASQTWEGASWFRTPTPIELTTDAVVEGIDAVLYRAAEVSGTVSGGQAYFGREQTWAHLYAYDWELSQWVFVDWYYADAGQTYRFGGLAPDSYAVGAVYESNRGIGIAFSDVLAVEEGDRLEVDLTVQRTEVGPERDFSGDWVPDVLAITSTGALRMYRGDGLGVSGGTSQIGSGWSGMNTVFQAGDFSGDGHTDVIARDGAGNLHLYRGNGAGGWAGSARIGTGWGGFTSVFGPGDFDGDGNVDVMARDKAGALHLYRGDGNGGWLNRVTVGAGWQGFNALVGPGDFDGDGRADVIARDSAGRLMLYPGNGAGGWLAKRQVGTGWQNFTALVGAGDLWGNDGFSDLLVRDVYGRLLAYPGNGVGGWVGYGPGSQVGQGWNGLRIVG